MSSSRHTACALTLLFVFACGGKTQLLDGSSQGGSSGRGGQGAGGVGGAGGVAGRGGAGGRGGTLGASGSTGRGGAAGAGAVAGNGGSPGGRGGTGASAGTSSAGAPGRDNDAIIEELCRTYERFICYNPDPDCRASLRRSVDTYEVWGCGDEWLDAKACVIGTTSPCDWPCYEEGSRFARCMDEAYVCVRGTEPGGGCVIGCETGWSAKCQPIPDGLLCSCDTGRRTGDQFVTSAACQSAEWMATTRMACE